VKILNPYALKVGQVLIPRDRCYALEVLEMYPPAPRGKYDGPPQLVPGRVRFGAMRMDLDLETRRPVRQGLDRNFSMDLVQTGVDRFEDSEVGTAEFDAYNFGEVYDRLRDVASQLEMFA